MLAKIKKRRRPILIAAILVILAVAALIIFLPGNRSQASTEATVSDYTVSTSDLKNVISGTGTLASEDAEDVTVPTDIDIEEVYVESGDTVAVGDALAKVDTSTVLTKITEVQESIATLDDEIESAKDSASTTATLTAGVSGRVKKIYAETGKTVSSTVAESGALMLISVDGLMAVDIEAADLTVGSSVTVTLEDGTGMTGTVKTVVGGIATITLSDNGPEFGGIATVTDGDGNTLGTGTLYINSPISVTAADGTVSSISVSENSSVSAGATLLSLKNISASAQYASLVKQREALAKNLQDLVKMAETGVITATFSGVVSAVNVSAGDTVSTSTGSSSSSSSGGTGTTGISSTDSSNATAMLLIATTSTGLQTTTAETTEITAADLESLTTAVTAPKALSAAQTSPTLTSAELAALPYACTITWDPAVSGVFSYGTVYKAELVLNARSGFIFADDIDIDISGAEDTKCELSEENTVLTLVATYAATEEAAASASPTTTDSGDTSAATTSGSSASASSGSTSSSASTDSTSTATSDTSSSGSSSASVSGVDEGTILTIAPNESMVISVSVDELDILSLAAGQSASVTLDAIENEYFTGTITKVNTTATSSGGVTKYTVNVEIPKTDDMLAGMNASVTITVEEATGILVIPVDAVQEMGASVFVYTEKDADGNLSGNVEIETGLSDGSYVEVTSGLSVGDIIYYIIATSDDSGASTTTNFSFDVGGGMGGDMITEQSGEMPSGGSMPDMSGGSFGGGQ